jgi:hypothetical protein
MKNRRKTAPLGRKWCAKHNEGRGEFLAVEDFPSERYSYCTDCKREYQRKWESERTASVNISESGNLRTEKPAIVLHILLPHDYLKVRRKSSFMSRMMKKDEIMFAYCLIITAMVTYSSDGCNNRISG